MGKYFFFGKKYETLHNIVKPRYRNVREIFEIGGGGSKDKGQLEIYKSRDKEILKLKI